MHTYMCMATYKFGCYWTHSILITQQVKKFYVAKYGTAVNWLQLGLALTMYIQYIHEHIHNMIHTFGLIAVGST